MQELIALRNKKRDFLPEGRPLDQYSDEQRVEMTQDVHNPDSRNTPTGGTFVRNPSGSVSARAPSPEMLDRKDEAWGAVPVVKTKRGDSIDYNSPEFRDAMLASAESQGLDPSQYRDPLVLRDADATRDFDIMYGDVMRGSERQAALEGKYMPVPAQFGKDGTPVAWKFTPNPAFQSQMRSQKQQGKSQQLLRNILQFHGRYIGDEMRADLQAKADAADLHGLRQAKNKLLTDQRGNAAKNVADRWENINATRTLNNPDAAPGFIMRSTVGASPHDRAAMYTLMGWEPAAARETQAGIANDAYNTSAAIASQQGGDAPEEDKSVSAMSGRHWNSLDEMIKRGDVNRAIAAHADYVGAANKDTMDRKSAHSRAYEEVVDRMAGMPQYRSDNRVKTRMTDKANEGRDAFVSWAASVGISPTEAIALYDRMKGSTPAPGTPRPDLASPLTSPPGSVL